MSESEKMIGEVDMVKSTQGMALTVVKLLLVLFNLFKRGTLFLLRVVLKRSLIVFPIAILVSSLFYFKKKQDSIKYVAEMVLTPQFNIGLNLYNEVTEIDFLIAKKDFYSLSEKYGIKESKWSSIKSVSIKPIITAEEDLALYNNYLKAVDTNFVVPIPLVEYLEGIPLYRYSSHVLTYTLVDDNSLPYDFQEKVLEVVKNDNLVYNAKRKSKLLFLGKKELLLNKQLSDLDTLKRALEKGLIAEKVGNQGTSVYLDQDKGDKGSFYKPYREYYQYGELKNELIEESFNARELIVVDSNLKTFKKITSPNKITGLLFIALLCFGYLVFTSFSLYQKIK